jgi:hypothetical protein
VHAAVVNLRREFPKARRLYDKNEAWVPTRELRRIGQALWPKKPPAAIQKSGVVTAMRAGMSVLFQLWEYIPYRVGNLARMQLGQNLYREYQDRWWIRFSGQELEEDSWD